MLRTALCLRAAAPVQRRIAACAARTFSSFPPHEIIGLPSLSPTMETGNMSKWNLKEGDEITAGTIVCEIETDKAVVDYEATDDMFLAKILIPEGAENIPVGQPMMVVCEEQEDVAAFKEFKVEDAPAAPAPPVLSPEEKPPKKEDVPVDAKTNEPVLPQDFLVTSQTPVKKVTGPAIPAAPAAKPAAPAAGTKAAAPAPASDAVFEEKWGLGMKKSAISTSLIKKQQAYIALYGITGMTPAALPEKK
ncbi:pyruvate dehydrogenase complex dihydrolipoamide acetyltransferase component (E2) [Phytophthora boehmeriae]|uniref:Pyruvate dehydrogenase complex dihydrolipoamide acetyltransferase component (E2) n=1 Tax=Phytophthora boehmeriae TaxID=109152 RepID=A0A8T1X3B0_9STRA|nr:pyruvate dehydrogenase complex dihydrolipoamide acetyltransferase component (E2) [Phytophthora boehmeriae]